MPYMIFLVLLMTSALVSVLVFGFSPLVYLILIPWTCILTLVRFTTIQWVSRQFKLFSPLQVLDTWFSMGSLTRPVDSEQGQEGSPTGTGGNDSPPPYEEIVNLSVKYDEGLPSYEEAVSSVSE